MKSWHKHLILANIVILISSCALARKPEDLPISISTTLVQAHELLDQGDYKKVLELYSRAYQKCHDPGLIEGYRADGERIREAADRAYDRKNFGGAGTIYRELLSSAIATDIPGLLTFDKGYILKQISGCTNALAENGLMKYREEKLDEAIGIWGKILAFDPGNQAIAKAVQTAIKQRQQLKNIK